VPTYRVELAPKARKALDALDGTVRRRVDAAIVKLGLDPFPPGAKALQGVDGYRVRVAGRELQPTTIDSLNGTQTAATP
jgi:mRNA interferase RelE/StbE